MKLCACGCGQTVPERSDGKNQRYLKGHAQTHIFVKATCAQCGKEFDCQVWRINKFEHVYCSRECHGAAKVRFKTFTCENCGKHFETKPARKQGDHVFCCLECTHEWRTKQDDSKLDVPCDQCGAIIRVYPSRLKLNQHFFCNSECRAEFIMGQNNPAYTTGQGRHPYYSKNWKSQRRKALQRDSYTCQHCGKRPKRAKLLHVHHITPFASFNGDYEKANQLTNLITLCHKCHKDAELGRISIQRKLL